MSTLLNLEQVKLFDQGLPEDVKNWLTDNVGVINTYEETWWFNYEQLNKTFSRAEALKEVFRRLQKDYTIPARYSTITTVVANGWQYLFKKTFFTNTDFGVHHACNAVLTIDNESLGLLFKLTWL